MSDKNLLLITEVFPYSPGEEFLEKEIIYWGREFKGDLIILPKRKSRFKRDIPSKIVVNNSLNQPLSFINYFSIFIKSLTSKIFLNELLYLIKNSKFEFNNFKSALYATIKVFKIRHHLKIFIKDLDTPPNVYCYWNDNSSYAAALLKQEGIINKLFSRIHRFDLYEEERRNNYMPLKRQLIQVFDKIFPISLEGKNYLINKYSMSEKNICIQKLGVELNGFMCLASPRNVLKILSVSYCVDVKRIDKIIDSARNLASTFPDIKIHWDHLGGGILEEELVEYANKMMLAPNLSWKFHGMVSNKEILKFYSENCIDVFINTSLSEGVPVSIMEALSFGVPVIAPNVGGISELVEQTHGILLSEAPSIEEITNALRNIEMFKSYPVRKNAYEFSKAHYNSKLNYSRFISLFNDEFFSVERKN
ncbi:glycosyltransferase [Litoribacter ruber]|uniref:glycosyltransferase n=1 Tax=Litoribacter ruber TaxID=702568 RepID=UPI001BDA36B8|nr:glycosyltransferase [Litoribacter ruber]MBT0812859.1 glycosyltransferase [Litoribacter ruber]